MQSDTGGGGWLAAAAAAAAAASCARRCRSAASCMARIRRATSACSRTSRSDSALSNSFSDSASASLALSRSSRSAAKSCCWASAVLHVGELLGRLVLVGLRSRLGCGPVGLLDLQVLVGLVELVEDVGIGVGLDLDHGLLDRGVRQRVGAERVERVVRRRVDERLDHQLVGPVVEVVDPQLGVGDRLDRRCELGFGLLVCPLGLVQLGLLRGDVGLELGQCRLDLGVLGLEGVDLQVGLRAL